MLRNPILYLLTGIVALIAFSSLGAEPWDGEPFAAAPDTVASAAREIRFPDDQDYETLLQQTSFRIDEVGRLRRQTHSVWRVRTEQAARRRALVEARWSPWYQQRPTIRARVIRPDGQFFELDPKTIAESAARQYDPTLLIDDRILQAPLPGMSAGCVIEEVITWQDSQRFFDAGLFYKTYVASRYPIRKVRLTIEAPANASVRHEIVGMEIEPKTIPTESNVTVVYEINDTPEFDGTEPHLPPHIPTLPYIAFSTGESWAAVAKGYAQLVESRVDQESVSAIVEDVLDGGESRIEAATKLLARIRQWVRYTGVEFGASAIVPYSPAETLKRRFGDCKDQATLLISMLRAAGYEAHVALLYAGGRERIRENLPGLNAFNHAIVYLPGEEPTWIDPTSPYTAPGELPQADQGRFALVASTDTTNLTRTPLADSAANQSRERITVELSTSSRSKVTRVLEQSGTFAASLRRYYAETTRTDLEKVWKEFSESSYETEKLVSLEFSNPHDLDKPFMVTAKFADAQWGVAAMDGALVTINPSEVFDALPWYLTSPESEENDEAAGIYSRPRKRPLQLSNLHVSESVFQIIPPEGYVLSELPDSASKSFGPVTYAQHFHREGESVVATFRLDTTTGRLTPAEVRAMRKSFSELSQTTSIDDWNMTLRWDHRAYQHYAAGRLKEALAEFISLTNAQPDEVVHYAGYVQALLEGGFGSAARKVARQVVAKFPDAADAHGMLGYSLLHDEIGRHTRFGFDAAGSARAYEKCLELDPEQATHRWNYAVLLEFDRYGNRYGPSARLQDAAGHYRRLLDQPGDPVRNLAYCLYFSERHDELKELVKKYEAVPAELRVAVRAIQGGWQVAKAEAEESSDATRSQSQLVLEAAVVLERGRHYELARQMYKEGAQSASDPRRLRTLVSALENIKRLEESIVEPADPKYPVQRLLQGILSHGIDEENVSELSANTPSVFVELTSWEKRYRMARLQSRRLSVPSTRREDAVTVFNFEMAGSPEIGYRIRQRESGQSDVSFFVLPKVKEDASHKVLLSGLAHSELGRHALRLLEKGDIAGAKQWMDWASQEVQRGGIFNPFTGAAFRRVWSGANAKKNDANWLQIAAAALAAGGDEVDEAIAILEPAVAVEESVLRKIQLQRALGASYARKREVEKVLTLFEGLVEEYPNFEEPQMLRIWAYIEQGHIEKAKTAAQDWLKKFPSSMAATQYLIILAARDGDHQQAYDLARRLLDQRQPQFYHYNSAAWQAMFLESLPDDALEHAQRACELSAHNESACLHTLATVLAEQGKVREAHRALLQAVEARPLDKINHYDWYVVGRIAEHLGLVDAARDAYAKVQPEPKNPASTFQLAQRRLKNLETAESP